ncbi:MAG: hypothetical protein IH849_12005 [Acidobacteria bacterium]|nr:hypothetical protein [Acidobacteriota bacterium]
MAAGMSGSPVYVDGKLIGAVSYRMGPFPKEPIAGITPIENMLRINDTEGTRNGSAVVAPDGAAMLAVAADLIGGRPADLASLWPASVGVGIVPIATPVSIGGIDPALLRRISPLFETMGWQVSLGGTSQSETLSGPLQPGSAISVQLMRGDITFNASGTVTWVEDDRLLAFGHPFLQAGSVDFPITAAEVLVVVPSAADSQKLTASGIEILGSIRQDRQAGILGQLGTAPPMVPVTVSVNGEGFAEEFNYEMVANKSLSPTFLFLGLASALSSVGALSGDSAIEVSGEFRLDPRYDPVKVRNLFSSPAQAFFELAQTITSIYEFLYDNPFEPIDVHGVDLDISMRDDRRVARITRVWVDRLDPRPGEQIKLVVWLKPYRQPEIEIEIELRIPAHLPPGPVTVLVGDSGVVAAEESSFRQGEFTPQNVEQLIQLLNDARPSDRIYYQLARPDQGASYGGRLMPSLPPSILEVLTADQTSGETMEIRKTILWEDSEQVEYVVSGEHRIELNVRRR